MVLMPVCKLEKLKSILQRKKSALIAFSGGVDSALLLYVARRVLGSQALAVTFDAGIMPRRELIEARRLASGWGARHRVLHHESLLQQERFLSNPPQRCYICKKIMMTSLQGLAGALATDIVMDGSNASDQHDLRPGMQALRELGVQSPLLQAGLNKHEIRTLARSMDLPVWNKPATPCLCTRIPYGHQITSQKLSQIEQGEHLLHEMGFKEVRLRHHGDTAHIELPAEKISDISTPAALAKLTRGLKQMGFTYVEVGRGRWIVEGGKNHRG